MAVYRPTKGSAQHLVETNEGSVLPGEIIKVDTESLTLRSQGSDLQIPWEYIVKIRDINLEDNSPNEQR